MTTTDPATVLTLGIVLIILGAIAVPIAVWKIVTALYGSEVVWSVFLGLAGAACLVLGIYWLALVGTA